MAKMKGGQPKLASLRCIVDGAKRSVSIAATAATAVAAASTAAATTPAVATAAATTTAATRALFARLGFVDGQRAAIVLLAVERGDRGLRFGVAAHLDKAEALAAAGLAIRDYLGAGDLAVR